MNGLDYFFLIGDFTVAIALLIGFIFAKKNNLISSAYYKLFWIGCFIGATWEFTFLFLGDEFLYPVKIWPYGLSGWPRKFSHSIWDGGIIMLSLGIFQELLVEYLFNGRVWIYEPLPWNPIIIPPLPGSAYLSPGYTLIPQAVWVIAPIVFYFLCLKIMKEN